MSVQTQLNRLSTAQAELRTLLEQSGVTVQYSDKLDRYPELFAQALQGGAVYLYKAAFPVDGWRDDGVGGYNQQAVLEPVAGAPQAAPLGEMASCLYVQDSFSSDVLAELGNSLAVLNRARKSLNPNQAGQTVVQSYQLQCNTRPGEKPATDIEVFLLVK